MQTEIQNEKTKIRGGQQLDSQETLTLLSQRFLTRRLLLKLL